MNDNGKTELTDLCNISGLKDEKLMENLWEKFISSNDSLHFACRENNLKVVNFLLNRGKDVNAKNDDCKTALHLVVKEGYLDMTKYLISKGATVNIYDSKNDTPLMFATAGGYTEIVKTLLEAGADVNIIGSLNMRAIHYACWQKNEHLIQTLVSAGADINVDSVLGTPLHVACKNGTEESIRVLINNGADINKTNRDGNTPLHVIKFNKPDNKNISKLLKLIFYNPDPTIKNNKEETAIDILPDYMRSTFTNGFERIKKWNNRKALVLVRRSSNNIPQLNTIFNAKKNDTNPYLSVAYQMKKKVASYL